MKILCVGSRKKKKKRPLNLSGGCVWQLGKHCPFRAGGEILELPVHRKKRAFFSLIGQQFLLGEVLGFEDGLWLCCVSVPALGWGLGLTQHHPGAFSSLLFPLPAETNPLKKTQHICASSLITDRCLFGPVMVLVSFFLSYLTVGLLACLSPVQSKTIRVWLKPLLVGGMSLLPRATSLMQKNTSWRCFVRCFYIKQFSSIVSVCQREIKCIYFPVCFREEFFACCGGFSHMAVHGHGCWNPHGRLG